MKFFDRADETRLFEGLAKRKSKKMVALFGRRRIGKTTLLKKAYPNARYFFVDTRSSETLLKDFSSQIFEGSFDNWEGFFRALFRLQEVVIFDEFQNFMRVDQSVFSVLQKVWDENSGKGLLILCGSCVGMMKRIFLDDKAPLFGRCDYKVELNQFRFRDALEMMRSFGYSFEEALEWYSVLGGIPQYLWLLEERTSFEKKIRELFFDRFSPLREEGKNLLIGEFGTEHPGYFSVLEAIGYFERDAGEIVDRTGMERTKAMKYLSELTNSYGIIERVENLLSRSKRGLRYAIQDNFLSFWMKYIYSRQNAVEFDSEQALIYTIENLEEYIGRTFESTVKSLIPDLYRAEKIPFLPERVGKHWGKIPGTRDKTYEIDLIGESSDRILVFECKWRKAPVGPEVAEELIEKMQYIPDKRVKVPVIISKSGFKGNMPKEVLLIDLRDLEESTG